MQRAAVRLRQPLGGAGTVGTLPENRSIAITIRLKSDALSVGGPRRHAIAPAQRETAPGGRAGQLINPDDGLSPVVGADREPLSVGRHTRMLVRGGRQLQR